MPLPRHRFVCMHHTDDWLFFGRCSCGWSGAAIEDKERAWHDMADHIAGTPEFQALLNAERIRRKHLRSNA